MLVLLWLLLGVRKKGMISWSLSVGGQTKEAVLALLWLLSITTRAIDAGIEAATRKARKVFFVQSVSVSTRREERSRGACCL